MEFYSPVSNIFTEKKELGSIIRRARDNQLSNSLKKINDFNFLDEIINEAMPDDTPEILLEKRRSNKSEALNYKNGQKRI